MNGSNMFVVARFVEYYRFAGGKYERKTLVSIYNLLCYQWFPANQRKLNEL